MRTELLDGGPLGSRVAVSLALDVFDSMTSDEFDSYCNDFSLLADRPERSPA